MAELAQLILRMFGGFFMPRLGLKRGAGVRTVG
jgi:hypothetical protein